MDKQLIAMMAVSIALNRAVQRAKPGSNVLRALQEAQMSLANAIGHAMNEAAG